VKHALVVGGAGFIGRHLCGLLLSKGYQVTALDSLVTGRKENLEGLPTDNLSFIEHDIREAFKTDEKFDEIYNLASPASPIDFTKIPCYIMDTAAIGHKNMLELAIQKDARILFASTSEVYGDPERHPQDESYWGNVNPIGPRSCYDEAKRYGEALTMAYKREKGVDARIIRIFNTYGPYMRPDDGRLAPNFIMQHLRGEPITVYGDGQQTRSFCYVQDLVEGMYALMQSDEERPVNIGNADEFTIMDFVRIFEEIIGSPVKIDFKPLPQDDPQKRKPKLIRASESLDWQPKVPLTEGLKKTVDYFLENHKPV
jgi:dTDP-glucose 4,6-dehydratase